MFTGVVLLFHVVQGVEFCKAFKISASTVITWSLYTLGCIDKLDESKTQVTLKRGHKKIPGLNYTRRYCTSN